MEGSAGQAKAKALMREFLWEQAIPVLIDDCLAHPGDPWSVMYLGSCYYELRQYSDAIVCYKRAAKLAPADSTPIGLQADALLCLGEIEKAEEKYRLALVMDPEGELPHKNWRRFQKRHS